MSIKVDLSLILVLFVVLTGGIWLGHRLLAARWRSDSALTQPGDPRFVEVSRALFPVAVIVLLIRSFLFEPYKIPSPSMMPTLQAGDFIFVNKFAYGLRLPVSNAKIMETGHPERGDVAVFRLPSNPTDNYIKRVVGLPNDHILYRDHQLVVNGTASLNGSVTPRLSGKYSPGEGIEFDILRSTGGLGSDDFPGRVLCRTRGR